MIHIPPKYQNAKYEDVPDQVKKLFEKIPQTKRGIYIHGDVGTGKTYIACALKKKYDDAERYRYATFWNTTELLRAIRQDFDKEAIEKQYPEGDIMTDKGLLFLDDVGSEKITDWVSETFYLIVNRRYNFMFPTIFTSNLALAELSERIGDRTTSRIMEICDVVELVGSDRRSLNQNKIKVQI